MYKVSVETSVQADGSLRQVWQTLHDRGLQVVQSAMHNEGDRMTSGHPVLSFAASCDICASHTDEVASDRCHLHFSVCDLLHLLPSTIPERTLERLVRDGCTSAGLQPYHVEVDVVSDAQSEAPNPLLGAPFSPPTPHLCWQMPATSTWGASKCPLSHLAWQPDGVSPSPPSLQKPCSRIHGSLTTFKLSSSNFKRV